MKTARTLHHEAMDKLRDAEAALEEQKFNRYNYLLNQAFTLESEAAYLLRDKFEAEPTRSVLFRGAATLALRCRKFKQAEQLVLTALTGEVPSALKVELLSVFTDAASKNSPTLALVSDIYGGQSYTEALRERSISLKVEPKDKNTGTSVRIDHAISVLRNVRLSYINYNTANYKREDFGQQAHNEKYERLLRQSISDELLISDLKQASFGFSISADLIMAQNLTPKVAKWKKEIFEEFKTEVIEADYSSLDFANAIASKYTSEELRGVYGPIVSMLQESNGYTVSVTNVGFTEVKKKLTPIKREIRSIVVPKIIPNEQDLKLYQTIGLGTADTGLQRENILDKEEINYMQFNRTITTISSGKSSLYFLNDYSFTIEYNLGIWSIDSEDFYFRVDSSAHKDILIRYADRLIELYQEVKYTDYELLTASQQQIRDKFDDLVSMASIE